MGGLFGKILLSFWLTALLLAGSVWLLERHYGADGEAIARAQLGEDAVIAATLLETSGVAGVRPWLQAQEQRLWLFDDQARLLVGRPLRPFIQPHIERLLAGDEEVRLPRGGLLLNHRLPGGYRLVGLSRNHHPHLPVWQRLLLAVALSGLVSLLLAALLSRSIRRLRHAAQRLAEGDLEVRVGYAGRDEVAALARDFDLMAERLRALLQSQKQLLSDLSHELRSPLSRLKVALELARHNGDHARALERIERESQRLEGLVSNVLSLARLESGQGALARRPLLLAELLDSVVQDARFEAQLEQRTIELHIEADAEVVADPILLRAAVENVVRNALRHTPPQSAVEVVLEQGAGQAAMRICDQGPGVPEADLERLFDPFTRLDAARGHSDGFGLGLAIGARAMQAHGGSISAANRSAGGLCVTLSLPLQARVGGGG